MKRKAILICLFLFFLLIIPSTFAFFTKSHVAWNLHGFNNVNSPITRMCEPYKEAFLDGNTGADVYVIYYFSDQFMSYVSTHTREQGYQRCLDLAGGDEGKQCFCYGMGTHIIQDSFSHVKGGLVSKYLSKYWSTNLLGHMTVEKDFENKHMELLEERGENMEAIEYYGGSHVNSRVCTTFYPELGGDAKYVDLLNRIGGEDVSIDNTLGIFCPGYKNAGFYGTVYGKNISLPLWFWAISLGMIIIGFVSTLLIIIFGKSNWKWLFMLFYILVMILGIGILLSFYTGQTWKVVEYSVVIPAKVGILSVSNSDVRDYDARVQEITNDYFKSGKLVIDDASGRTYKDPNTGEIIVGALEQASWKFTYLVFPIIVVFFILINIVFIKVVFIPKS